MKIYYIVCPNSFIGASSPNDIHIDAGYILAVYKNNKIVYGTLDFRYFGSYVFESKEAADILCKWMGEDQYSVCPCAIVSIKTSE